MISRYTRYGREMSGRDCDEVPPDLRYQRYQFTHITGTFSERSYRSGLRIDPPQTLEECSGYIRRLAKKLYFRNVSVDVDDLVQIGETALWEGLQDLQARAIRLCPAALKVLLEAAQHAMFHAIDQLLVPFPAPPRQDGREESGDERQEMTARLLDAGYSYRHLQHLQKEYDGLEKVFSQWDSEDSRDSFQRVPGAESNFTVFRRGCAWHFLPNCRHSWGAPLPPGSCQPRPTPLCPLPSHLPCRAARRRRYRSGPVVTPPDALHTAAKSSPGCRLAALVRYRYSNQHLGHRGAPASS